MTDAFVFMTMKASRKASVVKIISDPGTLLYNPGNCGWSFTRIILDNKPNVHYGN